jgi:hypothetical protein
VDPGLELLWAAGPAAGSDCDAAPLEFERYDYSFIFPEPDDCPRNEMSTYGLRDVPWPILQSHGLAPGCVSSVNRHHGSLEIAVGMDISCAEQGTLRKFAQHVADQNVPLLDAGREFRWNAQTLVDYCPDLTAARPCHGDRAQTHGVA